MAASLCQQLEAEVVDDKLAEQGVKNLVYVATAMHQVLEDVVKPGVKLGDNNSENGVSSTEAGLVNGTDSRLGGGEKGSGSRLANGVSGEGFEKGEEMDDLEDLSEEGRWRRELCPTLKSLFRRVARIALRVEPIQVSGSGGTDSENSFKD